MSGAVALLGIGLIALEPALGLFAVVLRRFPPCGTAATGQQELSAQAQAREEKIRERAKADGNRILGRAAEAAEQAAQQAADGRREVEDEIRAVKEEMRQLRGDLERREQRIGEREQRLDDESRRLEVRAQALEQRGDELGEREKSLTEAGAAARAELERVAGLTAEAAK